MTLLNAKSQEDGKAPFIDNSDLMPSRIDALRLAK